MRIMTDEHKLDAVTANDLVELLFGVDAEAMQQLTGAVQPHIDAVRLTERHSRLASLQEAQHMRRSV